MKKILKNIEYIDLFRNSFSFHINSDTKSSNIFGIVISLAIYAYLLILFVQSDLVERKNPLVLSQTIHTAHAEPIVFDKTHIITLGVSDALEKIYNDETIFRFEFRLFHLKDINGSMSLISLDYGKLRRCLPEDLPDIPDYTVGEQTFNRSYCLENKDFHLEGGFDEKEIYYVVANLYLCDNVTSNNTCKPKEIIENFFNNKMFFAANFYSASVDLSNYENPIQYQYINQISLIDLSLTKRLYFYMKPTEVVTDSGWLYSKFDTVNSFKFDSFTSDFSTFKQGQPISQMLFLALRSKETSQRKYQNLPQLLGSLTGIAHLFMLFGYGISNAKNHLNTLEKIINSLYNVPLLKNSKKKKKKMRVKHINDKAKKIGNFKEVKADQTQKIVENISTKEPNLNIIDSSNKENKNIFEKQNLNNNSLFDKKKSESLIIPINLNQVEITTEGKEKPPPKSHKDSFILEHFSEENFDPKKQINIVETKKENKQELQLTTNIITSIVTPKPNIKNEKDEIKIPEKGKFIKKVHKLDVGLFEYLKHNFKSFLGMKLDKKQKLIQEAEKHYSEQLDIILLLNKIQELEKLKLILLDSDQLYLFNMVTKPMIGTELCEREEEKHSNNPTMKLSELIMSYKSSKKNEGQRIYERISGDLAKNEINKRLIQFIDAKYT